MNSCLSLLSMLAGWKTLLGWCHSFLAFLMATPHLLFSTSMQDDRRWLQKKYDTQILGICLIYTYQIYTLSKKCILRARDDMTSPTIGFQVAATDGFPRSLSTSTAPTTYSNPSAQLSERIVTLRNCSDLCTGSDPTSHVGVSISESMPSRLWPSGLVGPSYPGCRDQLAGIAAERGTPCSVNKQNQQTSS